MVREIGEGQRGRAHERVAGLRERLRERRERRPLPRSAERAGGLRRVERVRAERDQRLDRPGIARPPERVDGREGAEEVLAANGGQQRFDGLDAADATHRLDRGHGHVVVRMRREGHDELERAALLSTPEDLQRVADDRGLLAGTRELRHRGQDVPAGRCDGIDRGGEPGFVATLGSDDVAERPERVAAEASERRHDGPADHPARVVEQRDQGPEPLAATTSERFDLLDARAVLRGHREIREGRDAGHAVPVSVAAGVSAATADTCWLVARPISRA